MSSTTYDQAIAYWGNYYGVPQALIKAIITVESAFNPNAQNPSSSAGGLMQLIDKTWHSIWQQLGVEQLPNKYDPNANIQAGTYLLKQNYDRFGNWEKAVEAYYNGHPSNDSATQSYTQKVLKYFNFYGGDAITPNQDGSSNLDTTFWIGLGIVAVFILLRRVL